MTFKHSGNSGDVISALPAIREAHKKSGRKATLYLNLGVKAWYYNGATHPVRDEEGDMVMLNQHMFDMLRPLLMNQPYIEDVKIWNGEKVTFDLDKIRETEVGMPGFDLRRWYFYVFPQLAGDLTKCYIWAGIPTKDFARGKIIVNRTQRYLNPHLTYSFLKNEDCVFAGTEEEHRIFSEEFGLDLPRLQVKNFLELAQALEQCRLFIGNQSMCAAIAQGLKVPRIIEVHPMVPNVIVTEENAYDYLSQTALEYYVSLYKAA